MGARSKGCDYGRSLAGIAGSNPAGDMDIRLLRVVWVVSWRSLQRADTSSREFPSVCH
jgi:hypothetical protein